MVTSFLIGLGSLFFMLGHSTLLFFKSKELILMPLKNAIFPYPKQGKTVSFLCLALSVMAFVIAILLPNDLRSSSWRSSLVILSTFCVVPCGIYLVYCFKRIRRDSNGFVFLPSDATKLEWSLPLLISAFVNILFWIFRQLEVI